MIYQHPLAYLVGLEGAALLRAWAGEDGYDREFVLARLAETRRLLDDQELSRHPGVSVERDATAPAYAQWAASYDDPGNGLFDLDEPVLGEIIDTLPVGRAVDAACGTGRLTTLLSRRGHHVVGVDDSPAMLHRAKSRLPGVDFVLGDLLQLPLADHAADLVITGLALTHIPELGPAFAEFARVLRPGGHLVISEVHDQLVLLGSAVKAAGPAGQPAQATTHRHTTADFLRVGLSTGFAVRRFEERPRAGPVPGPAPEPTSGVGEWQDWPWTLLGLAPEATRVAWHNPAVVVWHLQRD